MAGKKKDVPLGERLNNMTPEERREGMEATARAQGITVEELKELQRRRIWDQPDNDPIGKVYPKGTKMPESVWKPVPPVKSTLAEQLSMKQG